MEHEDIFIVFRKVERDFEVYLVNGTDVTFNNASLKTGSYSGMDDDLIQTNTVNREIETIFKKSAILLDKSDLNELDFVIWYTLLLPSGYKDKNVRKIRFQLPRHEYVESNERINILDKTGMILDARVES